MRFIHAFPFLSFFACSASAFAPCAHLSQRTLVLLSESSASDKSSDEGGASDFVTVESEEFVPTEAEASVTSLLDLIPKNIGEVSDSKRATINEVILKLEALNPTKEPAKSSLVNGVWDLRYAAGYTSDWAMASPTRQLALFLYSGGYSPGLFAISVANMGILKSLVDIQNVDISISREQPRILASVKVKSVFGESSVNVNCKLEVESDVRLRETYESTSVMGRSVEFPEMLRYSRTFYVTYVDEDILIIRDGSGVPELLVRKEKGFSKNWGTEPSEFDEV
jgi:hypothetical protein